MIRILHVYPEMRSAGTEMVIMNLLRNIDRDEVAFDFLVQREGESDEKLQALGANIHYLPKTKKYFSELKSFFSEHSEYRIVHTHTHAEMGLVLKAAKKMGVPCRIAHSHNSRPDLPRLVKLIKLWTSRDIESSATHFIACSREAAKWLYPRKHKRAVVWNNAIDLDAFRFSDETRKEYREKLDIPEGAKVIAHVGRFAHQKNHAFIIDALNELIARDESVVALLVGDGPLFDEMKARSNSDAIRFLGHRSDVPEILAASDLFFFPSNYEGLGIVAVEAQASGIYCLASTGVPAAADIGIGLFERLALTESMDTWLERIADILASCDTAKRAELSEAAFGTEYNIKRVAKDAQSFYLTNS